MVGLASAATAVRVELRGAAVLTMYGDSLVEAPKAHTSSRRWHRRKPDTTKGVPFVALLFPSFRHCSRLQKASSLLRR